MKPINPAPRAAAGNIPPHSAAPFARPPGKNHPSLTPARRLLLCLASALLAAGQPVRSAAAEAKPGTAPVHRSEVEAAERKQTFEDALALFQSKDYVRAEKELLRSNHQKPGTLGWHLESAGKLTQVALVLRQQYDYPGAIAVTRRAQALLAEAESFATPADGPRPRAEVHEMKGYLDDELLRDPDAARAAYERARKLDPDSVRARQALDRLNDAQAKDARLRSTR